MAVKAYNTITLISIDDVNISMTEPESPVLDQLWLDTSKEPNELMRYDGTGWVRTQPNSLEELDPAFKTEYDNEITSLGMTITERTTVDGEPVADVVTELKAGELIIRDTLYEIGQEINQLASGASNLLLNSNFGTYDNPADNFWGEGLTWEIFEKRGVDWTTLEASITDWNDFESGDW